MPLLHSFKKEAEQPAPDRAELTPEDNFKIRFMVSRLKLPWKDSGRSVSSLNFADGHRERNKLFQITIHGIDAYVYSAPGPLAVACSLDGMFSSYSLFTKNRLSPYLPTNG
jgi:hypothetical protein